MSRTKWEIDWTDITLPPGRKVKLSRAMVRKIFRRRKRFDPAYTLTLQPSLNLIDEDLFIRLNGPLPDEP